MYKPQVFLLEKINEWKLSNDTTMCDTKLIFGAGTKLQVEKSELNINLKSQHLNQTGCNILQILQIVVYKCLNDISILIMMFLTFHPVSSFYLFICFFNSRTSELHNNRFQLHFFVVPKPYYVIQMHKINSLLYMLTRL